MLPTAHLVPKICLFFRTGRMPTGRWRSTRCKIEKRATNTAEGPHHRSHDSKTPQKESCRKSKAANFILFSCFGTCQAVSEIIRNILLDLSLLLSVGPVLDPLETENDARICELIPSLLSLPRKDFSSVSLALCNSCLVAKFSYLDLW